METGNNAFGKVAINNQQTFDIRFIFRLADFVDKYALSIFYVIDTKTESATAREISSIFGSTDFFPPLHFSDQNTTLQKVQSASE